ncbi:type II toxin-antitoxin system PemK/MazF family toxin, partial [Rhodococcus qingshengii]
MTAALRGQIYWADIGKGEKPWVVVSNNVRNRNLNTVLAARVTT